MRFARAPVMLERAERGLEWGIYPRKTGVFEKREKLLIFARGGAGWVRRVRAHAEMRGTRGGVEGVEMRGGGVRGSGGARVFVGTWCNGARYRWVHREGREGQRGN